MLTASTEQFRYNGPVRKSIQRPSSKVCESTRHLICLYQLHDVAATPAIRVLNCKRSLLPVSAIKCLVRYANTAHSVRVNFWQIIFLSLLLLGFG